MGVYGIRSRLTVSSNSTKEAELKAKAVTAQTKLDAMTSNTTLVDACSSLTKAKADGEWKMNG
jgi:hypothetical protein